MKTIPTTEYAGEMTPDGQTKPVFSNFFVNPWGTQQYGHDRIFEVLVREPKPGETPSYWSWWDEERQRFEFTWYWEGALEMCFAYGTKAEEERGRGKKIQTVVDVVREIELKDVEKITKQICEVAAKRRAKGSE